MRDRAGGKSLSVCVGPKRFRYADVFFQSSFEPFAVAPVDTARDALPHAVVLVLEMLVTMLLRRVAMLHGSSKACSSTTVAYAWLVLLKTLHFALFSRSFLSGPQGQASWLWPCRRALKVAIESVVSRSTSLFPQRVTSIILDPMKRLKNNARSLETLDILTTSSNSLAQRAGRHESRHRH